MASALPACDEMAPTLDADQAMSCLSAALNEADWPATCATFVHTLAARLGASRVSLAWVSGQTLQLVALSGAGQVPAGALVTELEQAMLEASHQQRSLCWPEQAEKPEATQAPAQHAITLAHQALCRTQGLCAVLSVPLARQGQVIGMLLCERSQGLAFTPADQQALGQLAQLASPALWLRHQLDRPWLARRQAQCQAAWQRLRDPAERLLRLKLAALALALLGLGWVPVPHQVTATARLEGAVQRVLSAPQDGFLREVSVRPGDAVKAGQVLAQLADEDLQGARRTQLADIAQRENEFADAFARGDRAQAMTAQNKLTAARAQLALVEQQLGRLQIVAPFDGIVIQGDLRQQLGAPLKRGEALLTLAPGLDWRVVLDVAEADIAQLAPGQTGALRLAALPDHAIALRLARFTPVAKPTPQGVRYEIEASPEGEGARLAGLRPGLQGVARLTLPKQALLGRALQQGWSWLRTLAWSHG